MRYQINEFGHAKFSILCVVQNNASYSQQVDVIKAIEQQ